MRVSCVVVRMVRGAKWDKNEKVERLFRFEVLAGSAKSG